VFFATPAAPSRLRRYFYVYFKTSGGGVTRTKTLSVVELCGTVGNVNDYAGGSVANCYSAPDDEIFVVIFQIGEEKSVHG
jgi:hypothetical protein